MFAIDDLVDSRFVVGAGDSDVSEVAKGAVAIGVSDDDELDGKAAFPRVGGAIEKEPRAFELDDGADDADAQGVALAEWGGERLHAGGFAVGADEARNACEMPFDSSRGVFAGREDATGLGEPGAMAVAPGVDGEMDGLREEVAVVREAPIAGIVIRLAAVGS